MNYKAMWEEMKSTIWTTSQLTEEIKIEGLKRMISSIEERQSYNKSNENSPF